MAFPRPTLPELIDRITQDLVSRLAIAGSLLRKAVIKVIGRVQAAAVHGLYGYIQWSSRQLFAGTADADQLDAHGADYGISRVPAAAASGNVTFTGTTGVSVLSGTRLQRGDGQIVITTADCTLAAGTGTAPALAQEAGASSNADTGTALTFVSPVAGIQSTAVVAAGGMTGGADIESDASYRARILARKRLPPHGGADFDYIEWAKSVPGVTRAWVYPLALGPGTVTVRFVRDNDASLIPDAAEVAVVQAAIDAARPVTASVTVVAPVPVPLNFTIALTPSTASVKAAVEAELRDLILRECEPGGTLLLTHIREAISLATGETDHVLVAPNANVVRAVGEITTFGAITWQ